MPFKDLLKKKEKISNNEARSAHHAQDQPHEPSKALAPPEFTIMRSDTYTQEVIHPPVYAGDDDPPEGPLTLTPPTTPKKGLGRFRKSSNPSPTSPESVKGTRSISDRFNLTGKSRSASTSSVNIPADLPAITDAYGGNADRHEQEAQWEERATILAKENKNPSARTRPKTSESSHTGIATGDGIPTGQKGGSKPTSISDAAGDENIQEAIRLHEEGDLGEATEMFGRLAETGNVLSQVLYGLSLRHGWGCKPDPARAVTYLSAAAANSANIESEALKSGMKKGGAAKGELVLAIFELANCFRNGWGVEVDKVAARQYYETAANLGDTDAMNEAAWCYLEGFGGKKDKFKAAQLLRLAETNGSKTLGNSWIWKDKYNPK